ncbi:hypothetical protein BDZ45DRAFT_698001 [Acephala macrosclerotiorum]|nr:hypothetical protein BDZ45DRAFT_698001 [Acephala macrosclerotiorum]
MNNKTNEEDASTKLNTQLSQYFGNPNKLKNWQRLCYYLGLKGGFNSITQCKTALKSVRVNIFDLRDQIRGGKKARLFKTKGELAKYTRKNKKAYRRTQAKREGLVRALLRVISWWEMDTCWRLLIFGNLRRHFFHFASNAKNLGGFLSTFFL